MARTERWGVFQLMVGAALVWIASPVAAQVVLDGVVSRVAGRAITQSDVRQADRLRLVDDVSSPEAIRRELENRWLALSEIQRAAPLPTPSDADVAARRAEWEPRVGGAARVAGLLADAGMTDDELRTWWRDDLRIRAYLDRQYGALDPDARAKSIAAWRQRLRARADLP
jgi:hypothetical protein